MGVNKDCFAYDAKYKECNALKKLYCKDENCKFYKNKKEVNQEQIEEDIKKYSIYMNDKGDTE